MIDECDYDSTDDFGEVVLRAVLDPLQEAGLSDALHTPYEQAHRKLEGLEEEQKSGHALVDYYGLFEKQLPAHLPGVKMRAFEKRLYPRMDRTALDVFKRLHQEILRTPFESWRSVDRALVGKLAFKKTETHHHVYRLWLDGVLAARTYISHGGRALSRYHVSQMARQAHLRTAEFLDAVNGPLSREDDDRLLRERALDADESQGSGGPRRRSWPPPLARTWDGLGRGDPVPPRLGSSHLFPAGQETAVTGG